MSALHRARGPARSTGFAKPVLVLSLAALLAACSSSRQPGAPQVFAWLQPQPQPPAQRAAAQVEMEDDGLPAQAAPPASIRRMPDDPSAPWSRNYGRRVESGGIAQVQAPQRDDWAQTTWSEAATDEDDGLPTPKSPAEAGVSPAAASNTFTGAYWPVPRGLFGR